MSILYISDLDGTLLNKNTEISKRSEEIINFLLERGIKFTYATARSFYSASKIVKELNISIPAITYNGAFFIDPTSGKVINSTRFSEEHIKYALDIFSNKEIYPLVYSFINGEERVSYMKGKENPGVLNYLEGRVGDKRLRPVSIENELYEGDIFYFTIIGEKGELQKLRDHFEDNPQLISTFQKELYTENDYWFEIMPADATKANGVKRLKEITGCDKVVCFGDALNDISMFKIADEAYAVKNANPKLKEVATGVIDSNDEDGVAIWLLNNTIP